MASELVMGSENVPVHGNPAGKSLRLLRPSVVVLCGPAACGKSTFAERHFRPTQIISSDWARARICDDDRDQRYNEQAFALVHFLVEQRLTVNRLCVIDSTALSTQTRRELLDLARKFQVPATLILFDVPREICIERDAKRQRSVGQAVIERQYQAFEQARETIRQEGFEQVVELQDGDLEKVQIEVLFRPAVRPVERPQRTDAGAPRRSERADRPSRPRPSGPGDNRNAVAHRPVPPAGQAAAAPQPGATTGSNSTPKTSSPRPVEAPAPVEGTQPAPAVHPPASPAVASQLGLPTPAMAKPQPASPAAPPPVPVETPHRS